MAPTWAIPGLFDLFVTSKGFGFCSAPTEISQIPVQEVFQWMLAL